MSDQEKKVLISVQLSTEEAIKNMAKAQSAIRKLRDENAVMSKDYEKNSESIAANSVQIKNLTTTLNAHQKVALANSATTNGETGAYAKLNLQYAVSAQKAKDLAAAYGVNSVEAKKASIEALAMADKLKAIDSSVGQNQRSVGDYGIAVKKLPGIFGEMQEKGQSVLVALRTKFDSVKGATMDFTAAMLAQKEAQAAAMLAAEKAAIAEGELAAAEAAGTATATQAATAEGLRATATASATVATEAGATAMKILKFAIASTGIGILVIALGAVVSYFTSTNEGAKKFKQVMNGVNAVIESGVKVMGSLGKLIVDVLTGNTKELAKDWDMVKGNIAGATTEIGKNYKAAEQNTKNQQMMAKREREWSMQRLVLLKEFEDAKIMASKKSSLDDEGKAKSAKRAMQLNEQIYQNDLKIAKNKAVMVENEQKLVSKKDYQAITDAKNKVQEIINAHSQQQLTIGNLLGKTEQRIDASNKAAIKSNADKLEKEKQAIEKAEAEKRRVETERLKKLKENSDAEVSIIESNLKISQLKQAERVAGLKLSDDEIYTNRINSINETTNAELEILDSKLLSEQITQDEFNKSSILATQNRLTSIAEETARFTDENTKKDKERRDTDLSNQLAAVTGNIDLEFKLKEQFRERERQAEILAAETTHASVELINAKYRQLENDADTEKFKKKFEAIKKYADSVNGILSGANELSKQIEAGQLQDAEDANSKKIADLDERLKKGSISQKEHDKQVAASAAELDKKKAKIARDQAIREKELSLFSAIVNTASAIVEALPNIPLSILAGVTGAIEIGTILATPLPKASKGMLLKGKSHAAGGIPIEAEGGEAIINKKSTAMYGDLLSAINVAGGGIAFSSTPRFTNDGGYTARSASNGSGVTEDQIQRAMEKAVAKIKVVTTIEDFRKADDNYTDVQARGTF